MLTSLFDEKLLVPEEYFAATVGLRKKCQSLKGAAGTKRKRLIAEYAAAKKKVESKIKFMKVPEEPLGLVGKAKAVSSRLTWTTDNSRHSPNAVYLLY